MPKSKKEKGEKGRLLQIQSQGIEIPQLEGIFNLPRRFGLSLNTIPDVDMADEGKSIKITVDLPGIAKGDIRLNV